MFKTLEQRLLKKIFHTYLIAFIAVIKAVQMKRRALVQDSPSQEKWSIKYMVKFLLRVIHKKVQYLQSHSKDKKRLVTIADKSFSGNYRISINFFVSSSFFASVGNSIFKIPFSKEA